MKKLFMAEELVKKSIKIER